MPLIRNIEFSYPPLAEQQRIVAKLDATFAEIDTAIEVAEAKEVEVEKLKSSLLGGLLNNTENNFNTVKLGDVCDLVGGGTPSKNNDSYYDGNIPWATVRDMAFNELYVTQHKITELGLKNSSSKVIPKNNIIIACRVGLGKVCILQQDTAINQDLRGVIPKRENEIDKYFLFYWFKGIANQIISAGRGATVQGVKLPFLNSLSLPQPPLAEQQRIVAKLDKAFADLESGTLATLKSKANYQALKSAILAQELQSEAA
jgi:type I restriction enzyme S subunit